MIDWQWVELEEVGSTSDEVKKHGVVVSALRQTDGRGRMGRKWESVEGNLFFSFGIEFEVSRIGQLILIIGLSVAETIGNKAKIKWPNDVLVNGKKVSGILVEKVDDFFIVGIGVNIKSSPKIEGLIYPATSLKEEGIEADRAEFLNQYINTLDKNLELWQKEGIEPIKTNWLKYAHNLGKMIKVKNNTQTNEGIFQGIDDNGLLLLENNNKTTKIIAGDVT